MKKVTKEVKARWLARMFFGVSHSYDLDINPHDEYDEFLKARVSSLSWGTEPIVMQAKFSRKFEYLLELYGIRLPLKSLLEELKNQNQLNKELAENLASHAVFPANW